MYCMCTAHRQPGSLLVGKRSGDAVWILISTRPYRPLPPGRASPRRRLHGPAIGPSPGREMGLRSRRRDWPAIKYGAANDKSARPVREPLPELPRGPMAMVGLTMTLFVISYSILKCYIEADGL